VLTGQASAGLVDVDLDVPEARAAGAHRLPFTDRVHGRPGAPASHHWYRLVAEDGAALAGPIQSTKFAFEEDPTGPYALHRAMLLEFRADGFQSMAPPSIHPTQEALRWERAGEPATITEGELRRRVAEVAAMALLARHWPAEGQRDEAALALCGMLLAGGGNAIAADGFTMTVARVAEDEEWHRRGKGEATARKLAAGGKVAGRTALAQRLRGDGARVVAQVGAWLGLTGFGGQGGAYIPSRPYTPGGDVGDVGDVGDIGDPHDPTAWPDRYIRLGQVEETTVRWLWPRRLPLGKLTIFDGDPGLGKSMVTLDIIARVIQGRPMPDGTLGELPPGEPAGVVLLSAEDGLGDTVRPRLRAAGLCAEELDRVITLDTLPVRDPETGALRERELTLPRDLAWVAEAARKVGARLVVVDPLMAHLDESVNAYRDQSVRAALRPLKRFAEEHQMAVLLVRHLNKNVGISAIYRGGGSVALIGAPRAGWVVAKHPQGPGARVHPGHQQEQPGETQVAGATLPDRATGRWIAARRLARDLRVFR
jgi:hypothetical protein